MSNGASPVTLAFDGDVAVVTLNRAASFNAINLPLAQALHAAVADAAARPQARALLLCGAGRSFCGGGDVIAMQRHAHDLPGFCGQVIDAFHALMLTLARLRLPVVAAVQGAAAGGGFSLAMAADGVVAARSARFVVAYPRLGTSTDGGLSFRLQQRLGPQRALALLLQEDPLHADAALALGLVQEVADDDALYARALAAARRLAAWPPQAVAELRALAQAPSLPELQAQLDRERAAFLRCAATPEFAARVAAFAAKSSGATPSSHASTAPSSPSAA